MDAADGRGGWTRRMDAADGRGGWTRRMDAAERGDDLKGREEKATLEGRRGDGVAFGML